MPGMEEPKFVKWTAGWGGHRVGNYLKILKKIAQHDDRDDDDEKENKIKAHKSRTI